MILALYEPDIPQNTGSIIRLCACLETELHIIEPCGFPFDDKRLRRVALDYYDAATIVRHASWWGFLDFKQGQADSRVILLTTKASVSYTAFAYRRNDILLFGRESSGVPQSVVDVAEEKVKIPLSPNTRSLNLALAASMALGEALRQTQQFPE